MPVCLNVYDGVRRLPTELHRGREDVPRGLVEGLVRDRAARRRCRVPARRAAARLRPRARRRGRRRVPARAPPGTRLLDPDDVARLRPERLDGRRPRADCCSPSRSTADRPRDAAPAAVVPEERDERAADDLVCDCFPELKSVTERARRATSPTRPTSRRPRGRTRPCTSRSPRSATSTSAWRAATAAGIYHQRAQARRRARGRADAARISAVGRGRLLSPRCSRSTRPRWASTTTASRRSRRTNSTCAAT